MQVVTNENMQEFIQNRKVPDFVPPTADANKAEAKTEATSIENKTSIDVANDDKRVQPRAEDGKFLKAESETKTEPEKAAKTAVDDDDDADLPDRVRRQIGKKHRQMKEAEEFARERDREAAVAEARVAELERQLNSDRKSGPAQAKSEGAPNPEDFKTVAEYADALVEYKMEQRLQKTRQEALQKQQADNEQQSKSEFVKRIEKTREQITDYDDVVDGTDMIVPPHVAQHIVESDIGPLLGYHLAKNPAEVERLSKLSPIRAIAELGKLEAKLEAKSEAKAEAKAPIVSKAPSPIVPLESGSTVVVKDPSKMNFQELRAYREAERAKGKR
jgi:hypothetical protein